MEAPGFAIDTFCGAGGLSLGFQAAGIPVAIAFDNNPHAVETYRKNFRHPVLQTEVRQITGKALLEACSVRRQDVLVVAGGPPCQGFSVQRRGADEDHRNSLVFELLRLVVELRPPFFLMENVPGLRTRGGQGHLQPFVDRARREGYVVHSKMLNAADYGVPQLRRRLFLVGERTTGLGFFRFPSPTHNEATWKTVEAALQDLPPPPVDYSPHPVIPNHQRSRMSRLNLLRISHVPQGGGWAHIPEELRVPCHAPGADRIGHRYVYGRLHWDQPSATITAKFDSFTRGKFAHPLEDRSITLREGARLQGFPDDFLLCGPKEEIAAQIGNAVPPLVAEALARAILDAVKSSTNPEKARSREPYGQRALF